MKKKILSSLFLLALLPGMLSLSSCLKDSRFVDFSKVGALVELPLSAYTGVGKLTPEALPIQSTPQTIPVVVNVAAPKALGTPLNVTLAVDQAALDAYNTANATAYVQPPAAAVNISSLKVTVPANQHTATLNIEVNTSLLDPSGLYVIPLTIVDGGGQKISNYKTVLLNVQAKNQYDGTYTIQGYVHRDADLTLGGPFKSGLTEELSTAGATSVSFNQEWANGSVAGGLNPLIATIDPTTNVVTVTSSSNATVTTQTGYNSHYDPATKTFYIAIIWNGTDPAHRSAIDTLTYSGPRP